MKFSQFFGYPKSRAVIKQGPGEVSKHQLIPLFLSLAFFGGE